MNIGARIKDMFKGMWEDTKAVSPIVATLVLVVVAITGAAGVGTIMGTFSSDVSEESNTGELVTASSTELLIAGSTTVQPVSELLAEAYMDEHQGIKVTVQGGGSGAGVSSAGLDIVDIGAASRDVKSEEAAKYPDLKTHKIGGSAVVVIVNKASGLFNATKAEINEAYVNDSFTFADPPTAAITKAFDRSEESGTEDTFCKWIGNTTFHGDVEGKSGNAGVLKAVEDTPNSIGFVDFGFADGSDDVIAIGLIDGKQYNATESNIKDQLKDKTKDTYPDKLARPLNYMTNGEPNSMEQAFITFAMSPGATKYFEDCGYFPVTTIA